MYYANHIFQKAFILYALVKGLKFLRDVNTLPFISIELFGELCELRGELKGEVVYVYRELARLRQDFGIKTAAAGLAR